MQEKDLLHQQQEEGTSALSARNKSAPTIILDQSRKTRKRERAHKRGLSALMGKTKIIQVCNLEVSNKRDERARVVYQSVAAI